MKYEKYISLVLKLREDGRSLTEIVKETGLGKNTIKRWLKKGYSIKKKNFSLDFSEDKKENYSYILGLYLGDGHIVKAKRVYKLGITLFSEDLNIINRCRQALEIVFNENKISQRKRKNARAVEVYVYNKYLPLIFPQHGAGKKHNRRIILEPWQNEIVEKYTKEFVKGLIDSDGCVFVRQNGNYRSKAYQFTNMSEDIKSLFCWGCNLLGVQYSKPYFNRIEIARRDDVEKLDSLLGSKYDNENKFHDLTPRKAVEKEKILDTPRCIDCKKECSSNAIRCKSCSIKEKNNLRYQTKYPPVEELLKRLESGESYLALGREVGVSDNAIRKYIKRSGFENIKKQYVL